MGQDDPTAVVGRHPIGVLLAHVDTEAADATRPERELPRGSLIGRYLTLDRIGTGGMGVVYAAYDPELDRRIAIKVLRVGRGEKSSTAGRARLLREAQALARLSHPNVIAVHDVGPFEDGIFLALDLVDGMTLGAWQRDKPRTWQELRAVYLLAGQGLMAAHKSGLVHRDFKPDNVLVARDGSVHVTDFGLALVTLDVEIEIDVDGDDEPLPAAEGSAPTVEHRIAAPSVANSTPTPAKVVHDTKPDSQERHRTPHTNLITQAGTILGTPPYMSPEQHAGGRTDARSDQFSFCVSLYEALYGEHPFASSSKVADIVAALKQGTVRPAPAHAKVPAWLRRALVRGLAIDPALRYPSFGDLLHDLGHQPGRRRRRFLSIASSVLVGGALAATAIAVVARRHTSETEVCNAAADGMSSVWNDTVRGSLKDAFVATGAPYAESAWTASARSLDEYTRAWRASQIDTCVRTRVQHVQSEELLDRRSGCLDDRLDEVRQLTALFAHADASTVEHAVGAASSLPALDDCEDTNVLLNRARPPTEPEIGTKIAAVQARLIKADTMYQAGQFKDGLALATSAMTDAAEIKYSPLSASAMYLIGRFKETLADDQGAQAMFVDAAEAALAGGDEPLALDAWLLLIRVEGHDLQHYGEAERSARLAAAIVMRSYKGSEREVTLHHQLGVLYRDQAKLDVARTELDAALELANRIWGEDDPKTIIQMFDVASLALTQNRYDDAEKLLNRILALEGRRYGPAHPAVAHVWGELGSLAYAHGKFAEAKIDHQRQIDLTLAAFGPDHPNLVAAYENLGVDEEGLTHYDDAIADFNKAMAIASARDPDGIDVARALSTMGGAYHEMADFQSIDVNQRALVILRRVLGPDHWEVAQAEANLGVEYKGLGRFQDAYDAYQRAKEVLEKTLGREHTNVGLLYDNEGEVLRLLGKPAAALEAYQHSLAVLEKVLGPEHIVVADPLTGLGRTYLALGKPELALAPLERALVTREREPGDVANLAETRFATAQALIATHGDRERALKLATQARDAYAAEGAPRQRELKDVDDWLKGTGSPRPAPPPR